MLSQMQLLGELRTHVWDCLPAGAAPELAVVLCHGFGAPGSDLVGLGPEIVSRSPEVGQRVRFYFPAGPLSLEAAGLPGGRAWWMLDLDRLNAALQQGAIRDLRNDQPAGLPAARQALFTLLEAIGRETGLSGQRIVLGGFSQGAMLATDVALRLPDAPALLTVFSGTLLDEEEWRQLAARRGHLAVLQSHGEADPLLPYVAAEWLRDLFLEAGFAVEFIRFPGPHTIPPVAVTRLAVRLEGLVRPADIS